MKSYAISWQAREWTNSKHTVAQINSVNDSQYVITILAARHEHLSGNASETKILNEKRNITHIDYTPLHTFYTYNENEFAFICTQRLWNLFLYYINYSWLQLCPMEPFMRVAPTFTIFWVYISEYPTSFWEIQTDCMHSKTKIISYRKIDAHILFGGVFNTIHVFNIVWTMRMKFLCSSRQTCTCAYTKLHIHNSFINKKQRIWMSH